MAAKRSSGGKKGGGYKKVANPLSGGTMNKGSLHRQLGVPQGQKIPAAKMAAARKGRYGPLAQKRANMAKGLAKIRPKGK